MSSKTFAQLLVETTQQLSEPESLKGLCFDHTQETPLPSAEKLRGIIELSRAILFPGYFGPSTVNSSNMSYHIGVNLEELYNHLRKQIAAAYCFFDKESDFDHALKRAEEPAKDFVVQLPELRRLLATDVEAAYNGDPAAESYGEIISCYPVIRALTCYRIAHALHLLDIPLIPRIIGEIAHSETGIDIHPSATIGDHFTIDHGTGVVIGATCVIGNNVKLYQGVTLGAKSFPLDENGNPIKGIPRHPILEDDVIVYSNATILGRITVGKGSIIGGNIWVTEDVPAGSRMVQRKQRNERNRDNLS
jgi:serine O-acetyltransferase